MSNWITVKGRHIDLDDPHNPVTGDGKFGDLKKEAKDSSNTSANSKGDIRTRAISIFTKDPEERAELERRRKEKSAARETTKEEPKKEAKPQIKTTSNVETKKTNVVHEETEHKKKQLEAIKKSNPMRDDVHTGVRTTKDIYTLDEARQNSMKENDGQVSSYPDVTKKIIEDAIKTGTIMVYSSKPISQGGFISPSRMMAQDYAGSGKVYSQRVKITDIAWLNTDEGQIAKV